VPSDLIDVEIHHRRTIAINRMKLIIKLDKTNHVFLSGNLKRADSHKMCRGNNILKLDRALRSVVMIVRTYGETRSSRKSL
jgi:hypothetical protein